MGREAGEEPSSVPATGQSDDTTPPVTMGRFELLLAAAGAFLLVMANAAPASTPTSMTAQGPQGDTTAGAASKMAGGVLPSANFPTKAVEIPVDLSSSAPSNMSTMNSNDQYLEIEPSIASSENGGNNNRTTVPKELSPEETADYEALFSQTPKLEEKEEDESSKEVKKRKKKEKKARERKEKEERERKEKEERERIKKEEKEALRAIEEEEKRKEEDQNRDQKKTIEGQTSEKNEEHTDVEREREARTELEKTEEKERRESVERERKEGYEKGIEQKEEQKLNDGETGEESGGSVTAETAETPIVSKSTQSDLAVSGPSPIVSAIPQPEPQPSAQSQPLPQAAAWTTATSWTPAVPAQGPSSPGQPRQTFNILYSTPFNPSLVPQSAGNDAPMLNGRSLLSVSATPAPVPREKVLSSYLHDTFQYSDTNQLLDNLKRGQPLPPQNYNGVMVNFKVTGFDGKPVVNQAGPWASQSYTAPPAPAAAPAQTPYHATDSTTAAGAPVTANLNDASPVTPIYFLNFQGKQIPVYDSSADSLRVWEQLKNLGHIQVQQQEYLHQLRQLQAELAQQQTTPALLYHRPSGAPLAQGSQQIQLPVPTVLKSGEGGKYLTPIQTSTATINIPSSLEQQQRGLGGASAGLEPIPGSSPVFSIDGPMTVVANQGPSSSLHSYSSGSVSSASAPPHSPSSAYSAAAAAASAGVSPAYSGVLTPGVPESLGQFAKQQAAGGAPSGSAYSAPYPGAASTGAPEPFTELKSLPIVGGSSSASATIDSPERVNLGIPGATGVLPVSQYSQYSSTAPQQVFTFASVVPPGTAPAVTTGGTSGVLRQLPMFFTPAQQQQSVSSAQGQLARGQPVQAPYTLTLYATQTKA